MRAPDTEQMAAAVNDEDPTAAAVDAGSGLPDPRMILREEGLKGYVTVLKRRVRGGELGSLPVVIGLIIIWGVFQSLDSRFLSANNLSNLALQMTATGMISIGIVFVLLLGEIDLSVGSVSGLTASILAVMNVSHGWSAPAAILAALAVGGLIGFLQGAWFAKIGVPSFVVTLAGLIAWQGLQLTVLGSEGTINLDFTGGVAKLTSTFYVPAIGFTIAAAVVAAYVLAALRTARRRAKKQLPSDPISETVLRAIGLAIALFLVVYVMDQADAPADGLPLALVIFGAFVVGGDLILRKTTYGRHLFAVGGGVEAARRAGINVSAIRISVFVVSGLMAAAGGVMGASRLLAVNQSSGGSDILLNAIAAAVIGGTSLFGGRGSTYSALLGILVIQSIANGMLLLNLGTDVRFTITGAVLLLAVTVDAVSRRGRETSGRG